MDGKRAARVEAQGSTPKKMRLQDPRMYERGTVIKIRVKNFMTYKSTVIEPGPRLNVILGPNGTGKSSLVCALCVGLAGGTKLLGRADSVKDFVRHGESEGEVEIWLSKGKKQKGEIRVTRKIRTDNTSRWWLNGAESNMKAVKDEVAKLNIQLDNLCQFLPQDKVVEFAKLRPTELLEETQKAIGDARLYNLHQRLVAMKKELNDKAASKGAEEKDLEKLERDNALLERDVQRFQEKDKLHKEVEMILKKMEWLRGEELRKSVTECKAALRKFKTELAQAEAALKAAKAPCRSKERQLHDADNTLKGALGASKSFEKDLIKRSKDVEDMLATVDAEHERLASLEADSAAHLRRLAELRAALHTAEQRQADYPPLRPGIEDEQAAVGQRQSEADYARRELCNSLADLSEERGQLHARLQQLQGQLQQLNSIKEQRLRMLERVAPGITDMYHWVTANASRFRGKVYGPIGLEVDVPDALHAAMLEAHVSKNMWGFFVVQHAEDQRELIRQLQLATRRKPAVTHFSSDPNAPIGHPDGEASDYARWGVTRTLDQVFDAPSIIKHTLCNEAGVNRAYVGTDETERQIQEALANCPKLSSMYTPRCSYRMNTSRYNAAARSTVTNAISPARLLRGDAAGADAERLDLQQRIEATNQELKDLHQRAADMASKEKEAKDKLQACIDERDRLDQEKRKHAHGKQRLAQAVLLARNKLQMHEKRPDPKADEPAIRAAIAKVNKAMCDKMCATVDVQRELTAAMYLEHLAKLKVKELKMQMEALRGTTQHKEQQVARFKDSIAEAQRLLEADKRKLREFEHSSGVSHMDEKTRAAFDELPQEAQELEDLANAKSAEADAITCNNPGVLEEYRGRARRIAELKKKLEAQDAEVSALADDIAATKAEWLPELKEVVGVINESFSESFKRIGCAGEVALVEEEDFDKYSVQIRVKFREAEDLRVLTSTFQSGGERSVSTILYLIAIQGVTETPFRVVDEINQGMDPQNERKVFDQLVESATQGGTPQCFLLTPKLLPDLQYSSDVTVLQIMNGPHVSEIAGKFTAERMYGSRLMAKGAAAV